jgi:hypothetical protein
LADLVAYPFRRIRSGVRPYTVRVPSKDRLKIFILNAQPKVAVFIDGANLYATTKALGFDIDYKMLLQELQSRGNLLTFGLASGSQSARRNLLERFRTEFGQVRLKSVERRHVQRYISLLKTPSVQRNMLQALKHFFKYCVDAQLVASYPAAHRQTPMMAGRYAHAKQFKRH